MARVTASPCLVLSPKHCRGVMVPRGPVRPSPAPAAARSGMVLLAQLTVDRDRGAVAFGSGDHDGLHVGAGIPGDVNAGHTGILVFVSPNRAGRVELTAELDREA